MAITLDTIVNKVFKVVKNGYDNNEVEAFLDEILEEMENREAETEKLKAQVATLTAELEQAKAQAAARPAPAPVAAPAAAPRSTQSYELILSKAQGMYDEIVAEADARAEEIVSKANEEAASIREKAEDQISDLTGKLAALRKQTAEYYANVKKAVDAQAASMDQLKKLL